MSRKRHSGHYCWSCGRMRANEKFSGRGHARHLCKECARLGNEELAYRQAVRDIDHLITYEGHIPRKKRKQFQKYLEHENPRVRAYAEEVALADALESAEQRLYQDLDKALFELHVEEGGFALCEDDFNDDLNDDLIPADETEIPF